MMKTRATISGIQLFWLMTLFEVGMAAFLMVSPTIQKTQNDAWISLTLSGVISLFATWVGIQLGHRYPDQTFIEYLPAIVGLWMGKALGAVYVIHWLLVTGMVFRQVTDVLVTYQFHTTPIWFFVATMAFLAGHVLRAGGLRSLGRVAEVTGPVVIVVASIVYLFSLPNAHWKQLLPLYVNSGLTSVIYGSLPATSFLAQSAFITMLYPFVKDPLKSMKMSIWGVALASFFVVTSAVLAISVFGSDLAKTMWNPVFSMTMYISVGEIVQNVEAFVIIVWFLTAFIRMALFLFLSVYGLSQLVGIQRWHSSIWWIAGFTALIAMLPRSVMESTVLYPEKVIEPFVLPVLCLGVPLGLWMISRLRSRG